MELTCVYATLTSYILVLQNVLMDKIIDITSFNKLNIKIAIYKTSFGGLVFALFLGHYGYQFRTTSFGKLV